MNKNSNNLCELPLDIEGEAKQNKKEQSLGEKQENSSNQSAPSVDSFGKFNSAEALLKAYNGLEAEFTKRSQELKRLERELEKVKAEKAEDERVEGGMATSEPAKDETGIVREEKPITAASAEADYNEEICDEDEVSNAVARFLSQNPSAGKYAEEIALKASERKELEEGFLERAYIAVLEDLIAAERDKINDDFIYSRAADSSVVKQKIIRDYLNGIMASRGAKLLSYAGESGQSVVIPPRKPLSISEAGALAVEALKNSAGKKYN